MLKRFRLAALCPAHKARSGFAIALSLLPGLLTGLPGQAAAADRDGLNDQARASLYSAQTALVMRLDAAAIAADALKTTFEGMFDPEPLAVLRANAPQYETLALGSAVTANDLFDKIGSVTDRPSYATIVALEQGGTFQAFAAAPVGAVDKDAFDVVAAALKAVLKNVTVEQRGDLAVIHQPTGALDAAPFDKGIQTIIFTALDQAPPVATINAASPMSPMVKAMMPMFLSSFAPAAAAELAFADYAGGFAVTGARPELRFYATFGSTDRADAVLAGYDAGWAALLNSAKEWDAAAANPKPGEISIVIRSAITWTELISRLRTGFAARVFGTAFLIELDTADLRTITGAMVDRYVRPVPE